jgi:hypothetical protein
LLYASHKKPGQTAFLLTLVSLGLAAGCTTPVTRADPALLETEIRFLEPGVSTRQEILFRMGSPYREYEDGRIITYQLRKTDDGDLQKVDKPRMNWGGDEFGDTLHIYSLVLAFDEQDRLSRQSLVLIR